MSFSNSIRMGIPTPTGEEDRDSFTVDGMRRAIEHASRDSSLIRGALDSARFAGSSGEDTYVVLAYHALRALEVYYRETMKLVSLAPMPPMVRKP